MPPKDGFRIILVNYMFRALRIGNDERHEPLVTSYYNQCNYKHFDFVSKIFLKKVKIKRF